MKPYFFDHKVYLSQDENIQENWISGQNKKGLLVVFSSEDKTDENINLLNKILSSINYSLEEDCINISIPAEQNISILNFINDNNIKYLISFGRTPDSLGFSFENANYKPLTINNVSIILASSIEKIKVNQQLKKALWASLKSLFNA